MVDGQVERGRYIQDLDVCCRIVGKYLFGDVNWRCEKCVEDFVAMYGRNKERQALRNIAYTLNTPQSLRLYSH